MWANARPNRSLDLSQYDTDRSPRRHLNSSTAPVSKYAIINSGTVLPHVTQSLNTLGTLDARKVAVLLAYPKFQQQPREKLYRKPRHEDDTNLDPNRYYTAVTQRSTKSKEAPEFDALVRTFVPLPNLFEDPNADRVYSKNSIETWKRQVVKVVPDRPKFSAPANVRTPKLVGDYSDDFLTSCKPHFYHANKKAPERHFWVNPEWLSEHKSMRQGKAYKTTIVLG